MPTVTYTAGYNMPGYLPEADPAELETFDDAKRYIVDELLRAADEADSEETAEELTSLAEDVNLWSSAQSTPPAADGYVYWIAWQDA